MAQAAGDFSVKISNKEVVVAVLPMQEHWLPLSNLDLLLPPVDVGVFFCYKNPNNITFGSMVTLLKEAMAQTLVAYYPFAGEIVKNSEGEPEILCNNRGVDFFEAFADIALRDLNLYNPDESIEGKLVPSKKDGVLAIQVTKLKCGGMVVACTFDHRIADAYSANMFLVSWAQTAQSKPISKLPSFRRSLLNPRRQGFIPPSLNNMYIPISSLPPPPKLPPSPPAEDDHLISRIYSVSADTLCFLQSLTCRTKLESFCGFLWKLIAQCEKRNEKKIVKMGIVVDGRTRLDAGDDENLMDCYFGNVLSIPFGEKKTDELIEKSLNWVAEEVHEFVKIAVTKEHFLGLIDWVENLRPAAGLAKIYGAGSDEGAAFVVSSGQRFPDSEVDFGSGKPVFGSYHFPWGGKAGYVMPMRRQNGDWVVYMHLLKRQVDLIETTAGDVFKPLTFDYLCGTMGI